MPGRRLQKLSNSRESWGEARRGFGAIAILPLLLLAAFAISIFVIGARIQQERTGELHQFAQGPYDTPADTPRPFDTTPTQPKPEGSRCDNGGECSSGLCRNGECLPKPDTSTPRPPAS